MSSGSGALRRELPATPAYVRTVETPDPRAGESALVVAARERVAKAQANCIILNFSAWYEQVRRTYAGMPTPRDIDRELARCTAPGKRRP